jgi:hypothetical protein
MNAVSRLLGVLVLVLALAPLTASAGPLRWAKWYHTPPLPTSYDPVNYWAPGVFFLRAYHSPIEYHQYAPGPNPAFFGVPPPHAPATPPADQPEVLPPPQKVNGK